MTKLYMYVDFNEKFSFFIKNSKRIIGCW